MRLRSCASMGGRPGRRRERLQHPRNPSDANGRPWPAGPAREPPSTWATTVASTARVDGQAGTTTHRCTTSKPHWAHGHGELSLGRSADPRRVAEARIHRLRTHCVAVFARPKEGTVAELAYVPRERVRPAGVRPDGDVIGRGGRSRCRRRPCLPFRPAEPALDRRSVALPGCGHPPIGVPRFTDLLAAGTLPRISRTTAQPTSHRKDR
jgi:hypothetical protein